MNESKAVDTTSGVTNSVGPYTIYSAGGLFTQHELGTCLQPDSKRDHADCSVFDCLIMYKKSRMEDES
jgi:hypothetical protein